MLSDSDELSDVSSNFSDDFITNDVPTVSGKRPTHGGKMPAQAQMAAETARYPSLTLSKDSPLEISDADEFSLASSTEASDSEVSNFSEELVGRTVHGGKQPRQAFTQSTPADILEPFDTAADMSSDELDYQLDLDDDDDSDVYDESSQRRHTTPKVKMTKSKKSTSTAKRTGSTQDKMVAPAARRKSWGVHHDPVFIPLPTRQLEKILSYKAATDSEPEKFLIKYKNTSYLHLDWVTREAIEGQFLGKHRLKKFMAQQKNTANVWSDEPFNPSYLQVDRVIDEGELSNPDTGNMEVHVLVRWCNQPYDESTWEAIDRIRELDAEKLDEFHHRRLPPDPTRSHTLPRPPRNAFKQLTQSPAFKYGNQLRSYQLEGLNWLLFCWFNRQSCIMADEMGLGKTVQTVSFLNQLHQTHGIHGPFLVVTPLSTVPHWEREFRNWTDLNVLVYHGSVTSRNLIVDTEYYYKDAEGHTIPHYYKFDAIITTYEMIAAGSSHLQPIPWRVAVFDEAHRLKNKASKVLDMLRTYHMEHRLLLTGTPLQNSIHELFSLLNFLQPERFYDEAEFIAEYGSLTTKEEVDRIQSLLKPLMLRRFKEDVEKSIPVKEETVVEVELTSYQKKFYRAILERNFTWLKNGAKGSQAGPSLVNIIVELRKCCMHPFLITGAEERIVKEVGPRNPQEYLDMMIAASGKLVLIDKLLRKLREGNHKVLIFSQMTRCLDILADYLTARQYPYERIDGSIRGEARQASIDRFTMDPKSFVFLLCTRAGGVGINLTAADTCVIYDSDWNPQNDLQAQARCHRIGQTKPVKIYRLLTRNTYEKEMFDRAGMKLGLDKAVLQKMDVESALRSSTPENANGASGASRPPSMLSKKEVEELLKKGAYGALMDDDSVSNQFCEEDIDQILDRRSTVIRHEGNEAGSIFSKASFTTGGPGDDVDINDPEFWDKWAKKANIYVPDESGMNNPLIIQERRQRRAAMRYNEALRANPTSPPNSDSEDDGEYVHRRTNPHQVKLWTAAEKTRLERKLMIWGYGKWDQLAGYLPRRQPQELHAVVRCLVIYTLQITGSKSGEDQELLRDILGIAEQAGDPITEAELQPGLENIRGVPFANANKRQTVEYRSFLIDSPADYQEHIKRKGRNLLLRIQLMHTIRDKLVPEDWEEAKRMEIPKITGSQPADWWGVEEDRDLVLGIYKYGYQQYHRLLTDPELHFHQRHFINAPQQDDDEGGPGDHPLGSTPTAMAGPNGHAPHHGSEEGLVWPTKAEIGLRLRRIVSALQRRQAAEQRRSRVQESNRQPIHDNHIFEDVRMSRDRSNTSQRSGTPSRGRAISTPGYSGTPTASSGAVSASQALKWNKREQGDFYKTLLSYGVETTVDYPVDLVWTAFRDLANLPRKSDLAMEVCLRSLLIRCAGLVDEPVNFAEILPGIIFDQLAQPPANHADSPPAPLEMEYTGTVLTREKARRLFKRISLMNEVRECVDYPQLAQAVEGSRWFNYLPKWWQCPQYDIALMQGIVQYGINRGDLLKKDPDLPFYSVFQRSGGSSHHAPPHRQIDGKDEPRLSSQADTPNSTLHRDNGRLSPSLSEDAKDPSLERESVLDDTPLEDDGDEVEDAGAQRGNAQLLREAVTVRRLEYLCKQIRRYMRKYPIASRRCTRNAQAPGSGIKLTLKLGPQPSVSLTPQRAGKRARDNHSQISGKHYKYVTPTVTNHMRSPSPLYGPSDSETDDYGSEAQSRKSAGGKYLGRYSSVYTAGYDSHSPETPLSSTYGGKHPQTSKGHQGTPQSGKSIRLTFSPTGGKTTLPSSQHNSHGRDSRRGRAPSKNESRHNGVTAPHRQGVVPPPTIGGKQIFSRSSTMDSINTPSSSAEENPAFSATSFHKRKLGNAESDDLLHSPTKKLTKSRFE
ncbi:hypothetical protein IWQ61_004080 [Dispira simplex]|nr:hypothetical protein IWQ61_004080 [Dispira simplex]